MPSGKKWTKEELRHHRQFEVMRREALGFTKLDYYLFLLAAEWLGLSVECE